MSKRSIDMTYSLLDAFHGLDYIRRKYNATATLEWSCDSHDQKHGLLCIFITARCGHSGHHDLDYAAGTRVPLAMLHKVSQEAQRLVFDAIECIDGACAECRAAQDPAPSWTEKRSVKREGA